MPMISIYISKHLFEVLKWHRGLNKSKIASNALEKAISSVNCPCKRCVRKKLQARAQGKVQNAIATEKMERGTCEKCGDPKAEGHHKDYLKPLEVVWLCKKHHREVHGLGKKKET